MGDLEAIGGRHARRSKYHRNQTHDRQWKAIEIFPDIIRPMILPTISAATPITQSAPFYEADRVFDLADLFAVRFYASIARMPALTRKRVNDRGIDPQWP
jgi:hypothetical protein